MKYALLLALSICGSAVFAQPVITEESVVPRPGDQYFYVIGVSMDSTLSGQDVVWDFRHNISPTSVPYNASVGNADTNLYQALFPGSEILYETKSPISSTQHTYEKSDANAWELVATRELLGNGWRFYTNTATILKFPLTYGDSWTDSSSSYYLPPGDFVLKGYDTVQTLAWGKMLLSNTETVQNVLLLHRKSTYHNIRQQSGQTVYTIVVDRYEWYSQDRRGLLMEVGTQTYYDSLGIPGVSNSYNRIQRGASLSAPPLLASSNLVVFPTPAKDFLEVSGLLNPHDSHQYVLYNLAGSIVQSGTLQSDRRINLSSVAPGFFVLALQEEGGTLLRTRVVISH